MAASSSSCFLPLIALLFLFLAIAVESRPSSRRDDAQVLQSLFGSRLSSLLLAPPTPVDITEGSGSGPAPLVRPAGVGLAGQRRVAGHGFVLDFLRQAKMKRWNRKSMMGGRGCFGMKMDRIGSISGLGC
ncbi:C-type natriuretic peptide 2 [Scomber japonicus]|uniref:C-type natriuretic peptide 2 n=1 Tax=Scomber japonicus TaxID=13676 RepID=UPI0023058C23|nr:C-type natriuretic peptide 2 [Scomber japonicus]